MLLEQVLHSSQIMLPSLPCYNGVMWVKTFTERLQRSSGCKPVCWLEIYGLMSCNFCSSYSALSPHKINPTIELSPHITSSLSQLSIFNVLGWEHHVELQRTHQVDRVSKWQETFTDKVHLLSGFLIKQYFTYSPHLYTALHCML